MLQIYQSDEERLSNLMLSTGFLKVRTDACLPRHYITSPINNTQ